MNSALLPRLLRRCDWLLLLSVFGLAFLSVLTIYSATLSADGTPNYAYVNKQLVWLLAGIVAMVLVNTLDHHELPELSGWLYWLIVAALFAVLLLGREINGARSWFAFGRFSLQPSEFAKIAVVIALARFFSDEGADGADINDILRSGALVAVPLLLILLQPDLGTALAFVAIWLVMLWWAGARWWQLLLIVSIGVVAFAVMWRLDILADYQKSRITVLFNPGIDPRGQGYNLRQSLIAVGSGGVWGKGWLEGTQTHLRFLPERRTDFIFAVLGEERGFVGALLLLLLYGVLFQRAYAIVEHADLPFGRTLAIGCTAVLLFHVVLNLGMVLGLLPITGLPLPFFSYGGSHLMACMVLVGLLLNVGMRRGGINY